MTEGGWRNVFWILAALAIGGFLWLLKAFTGIGITIPIP